MELFRKKVQNDTKYTQLNFLVYKDRSFFEISWMKDVPGFGINLNFSWDYPFLFSVHLYKITIFFTFFSEYE